MLGNILINPKNQDIHAFGQSLFCLPCVMKKGNILQGEITILAVYALNNRVSKFTCKTYEI